MATFDPKKLDNYFNNRDYKGAADYLSSIPAINMQAQDELNSKIRELYITAEKENAKLQKMDSKQQQAYHYISAIDGIGKIPFTKDGNSSNYYGDKYLDNINNLKTNDDVVDLSGKPIGRQSINKIRIDIKDDETYNNYLENIGTTKEKISELGAIVTNDSNTGRIYVDIPTNNTRLTQFVKASYALNNNINYIGIAGTGSFPVQSEKNYNIKGITVNGTAVDSQQFNYGNLWNAVQLTDEARKIQQKAIEEQQSITVDEEVYVSPFLGHGQANAYKQMSEGIISMDDYKKIKEERTEVYNTLLKQAGLYNYQVFATQEDDVDKKGLILKEVDPREKDKLEEQILLAMDEKRLTYSAAMKGGELGTYITISPKSDSKGNIVEGEYGQKLRLFIPGLFKSSCDETFNADTKQRAVVDNADMKRWNYGKSLRDGNYVGYDKTVGAYILGKDENGKNKKYPLTEEQMLHMLNRENIVNSSVSTLLRNMDNEGNGLEYINNGKKERYNIDERAKTLSAVGVNELYPKGVYSDGERLKYQNDIYNTIMNLLSQAIAKRKNN